MGPRQLLESCFRNYTALTLNETILVKFNHSFHYIDVIDLKPSNTVNLFGDLDLKVDFSQPIVCIYIYIYV